MERGSYKKLAIGIAAIAAVILVGAFIFELKSVDPGGAAGTVVFAVNSGEKFRAIIASLRTDGLVRSTSAAEAYAVLSGMAHRMQPGLYKLSPAMSTPEIVGVLAVQGANEVTVTIPEGDNIYQIDAALANALVTPPGAFAAYARANDLEGMLFPDTYQFFTNTSPANAAQKMVDDWDKKAAPILATDPKNATSDLIMASILEKEVPDENDEKIVAGILWKRLRGGIPLDVDSTVCYAKFMAVYASSTGEGSAASPAGCYPLTQADYTVASPYNTYRYKGLPPAPIGNPGTAALEAAINPESSSYWYYLSDPATGKTIFSVTLDEQNANRVQYLKSH